MSQVHEVTLAWESIRLELTRLEAEPIDQTWFKCWSGALDRFSDLYIQALWDYSGDTEDAEAEARLDIITQDLKAKCNNLSKKLEVRAAEWQPDDPGLARVTGRMKQDLRFGVEAAYEADKRLDKLVQNFERASSKVVVDVGEPVTAARVRSMIREEHNRDRRRTLWEQLQAARLEVTAATDEWFLDMLAVRKEKAQACGFTNFLDFEWSRQHRTYSTEDARKILDDVRREFSPVIKAKNQTLAKRLHLTHLRPWDDVLLSEEPSAPNRFSETDYKVVIEGAYAQLSPDLGDAVRDISRRNHLDIMSRPNKVGGAFSTVLCEKNQGLVFSNGTGDVASLRVMLHETGHALHYEAAGKANLFFERNAPVEIMELVAYCFQFLTIEQLADAGVMSREEQHALTSYAGGVMLEVFELYDTIERFQHWVYQQPSTPSVEDLDRAWLDLINTYEVDWSDYEHVLKKGWQHGHIVAYALYSIEYVMAYLGLLLFIEKYREDPDGSIKNLLDLLPYGSSLSVPESFAKLGIPFPFTASSIKSAKEVCRREFVA